MSLALLPERLRSKIVVRPDGCWEWTAARNAKGYGIVHWRGRSRLTHTVVYELLVGTIPEGRQHDHTCRFRACQNPDHLEPVTPRENTLRGNAPAAHQARQTHCRRGHLLAGDNIYASVTGHVRQCKLCGREHDARRRERERKAGGRVR